MHVRSFPKRRFMALAVDWLALLYVSYGVYYLINHWYRELVTVRPSYQVPFPLYAWVAAFVGSFLLAVLWENVGISLGFRAFGLRVRSKDAQHVSLGRRIRRFGLDLVSLCGLFAVSALAAAPIVGLATLFLGVRHGSGISLFPGTMLWPISGWLSTLGHFAAAAAILAAAGGVAYIAARAMLRNVWMVSRDRDNLVDRIAKTSVFRAADLEDLQHPKWYRTSSGWMTILLIGMSLYVGWLMTRISIAALIQRAGVTGYIWKELLRPDLSHLVAAEPVLQTSLLGALLETVFMALMATVAGVVFAFPLSFLGARNIMATGPIGWTIYTIMRGFFNIVRSVETLIWGIIFGVWVGFGPFAGMLALTVHTIAALGKLYSEQVESIDPGPLEAIAATGARRWQVVLYGVIPQIIPSYLAFTLYRWDINVRMSTVIGLVGAGGIGRMLFYYKNDGRWGEMGTAVLLIVAVVWLMDYTSARVREKIT
ncbi:phosphonate ABC transporter, permease protein PhnE [Candidatus Bipolaricaulota bacterium]|nr:phosphonate ABC transporter, permease protein PhnE [Candidatus Bipolaricaulota bacterium]